jgi:nicotinate-nucleotide--dimethylbenzimidazole phosphoribosyltransferase
MVDGELLLEFYEVVQRRSAIRVFRPDPIPEDVVRRILQAGMQAPSGEHKQPWEFIIIKNPELRRKLADVKSDSRKIVARNMYPDLPEERVKQMALTQKRAVETAPVLIAVCYRNLDNDLEIGQMRVSMMHANAWQCIENMWLAATAEGLGFSPTFFPAFVYGDVKRLLGLPEGVEFAAIVRIGRKGQRRKRKPLKPLEEKLHYDKF